MSTTATETSVHYERDADGIVTLTLDDPSSSANTMNELYISSMTTAVDRLYDEAAADEKSVTGVVIASAKKTFFAGGDLKGMVTATKVSRTVKDPGSQIEQAVDLGFVGEPTTVDVNIIEVASAAGQGNTFRVLLTAAQ